MKTIIFKVGDRVIHCNHGLGKIIEDSGDPTSAVVEFDKETKIFGGEKILEVSITCLKKVG